MLDSLLKDKSILVDMILIIMSVEGLILVDMIVIINSKCGFEWIF